MAQQTRKDPRAKVLSMTVRYKSATLDEFIEHHSHDVSRGGMFIKTPQAFPPGTLLKFEVRIAEDRKVMQGVGRVVWKRELTSADADRPAGMGVKFIKLDDDSRRLIDQLLSSRRDETSAYDAEGGSGIETEATVGLGTEPLSAPPPKSASDAPTFFPKLEPAELPPPEDRTVMKQAAELLQEALREVGSGPTVEAKPKSLVPAASDEKEDTKPGRNSSKPGDPPGKLPEPKMPPMTVDSSGAARGIPHSLPATSAPKPIGGGDVDMAATAREITNRAREVAASKPASAPAKAASKPPAAVSGKPTAPAKAAPAEVDRRVASAQVPAAASSGSGRGLFWLLAVAVCAAGTWWLWKPRSEPVEVPANANLPAEIREAPKAVAPPAEPQAPTANLVEPAANAPAEVVAVASATAAAIPSATAAPDVPAAVVPSVAAPALAAAAKAVPGRVAKRKATSTDSDQGSATTDPTAGSDNAAATPKAPEPAPEAKPEPAAEAPKSTNVGPAPESPTRPAPAAPKKPSAPAADSDNPY